MLERSRLVIFSLMGGAYVGPAVHYWFNLLDTIVNKPAVKAKYDRHTDRCEYTHIRCASSMW